MKTVQCLYRDYLAGVARTLNRRTAVVSFGLLSISAGARAPQTAAEYVAEGNRWYELNSYERAASAYASATRLKPSETLALLKLAVSYNQLGRFTDALAAADAAVGLNPKLAEAHNERAYAQKSLGDEEPPDSPAEKQRYDAAIASFREALRLNPGLALAYQGLGDTYAIFGKTADAAVAYVEAVRLLPRDGELRVRLGVAYLFLNRDKEASDQLTEAVRLDPDNYEARGALATACRRLGRLPESLEQLRLALDLKPDYADGHARLALTYAVQGKGTAALDEYRIAEALDKSSVEGVAPLLEKSGVTVRPSPAGAAPASRGPCPPIRVNGPPEIRPDQPATFTALLTGGDPELTPTFNWTVSSGTISSGQGTSRITVDTNGVNGRAVMAFVAVGGLPKECNNRGASRVLVPGREVPY